MDVTHSDTSVDEGTSLLGGMTAEATAYGHPVDPFAPPKACEHRVLGVDDSVWAIVNDEQGQVDHREIRLPDPVHGVWRAVPDRP